MSGRLLIVGSIALDTIKTPCAEESDLLGGSAIYGSIAASRFTGVDVVGVVGDDFPPEHVEMLTRHGVDVEGIDRRPGKTFRWGGEYRANMNTRDTHFTELGVFAEFDPTIPERYREDPFVFLANIDPELQLKVLDQVRKPRLALLDTMNLWINIKREALLEVIGRVDAILINEDEALMLFETHSVPEAAEQLLELGLRYAIIKKGANGAQMFWQGGMMFAVPAMPLRAVKDPTGAGDTFAGGMIGYLASRPDPEDPMAWRQALLVGSACASYVVEEFSVRRLEELSLDQIRERCDRLHAAICCDRVCFEAPVKI